MTCARCQHDRKTHHKPDLESPHAYCTMPLCSCIGFIDEEVKDAEETA
jgi:hypothetical protein